jgi:hypothetical protein
LVYCVETPIIEIPAIHNVDGSGLEAQVVQDVYIVYLSRGDDGYGWDVSAKIQERVERARALVLAESRPGEQGQAQIDCGLIQCIHRLIQVDAEGIPGVESSGFGDETMSKIGVDSPVPVLVAWARVLRETFPRMPRWYNFD